VKLHYLLAVLIGTGLCAAQTVTRPKILGVAHIGLETNDIQAADEFYGHQLGYERFSLDKPAGGLMLNYYKVNDHQYIEIFPDLKTEDQLRLSHVAFETDNIQQLRDYLAGKGVKVPATLRTGGDGNISFMIDEPGGHKVEFVEYKKGSLHSSRFGKMMPETRVSKRIIHVGFTVPDRAAEDALFHDILGFQVMWTGGRTDDKTDWVDMRVPDGSDWLEYMLNVAANPTPKTLGVMNHMALGVESIQEPYKQVMDRGMKPQAPPKVGRDGKWQLNLYDPNLTRSELMEFKPAEKPCCSEMKLPAVIVKQ
jgi:catechol 2,3-dioxygenase-like lactoylglutathione lyase family enzyme